MKRSLGWGAFIKNSKWFVMLTLLFTGCKSKPVIDDPYLWLEEVEGAKPIEFAKTENKKTLEHFKANPIFNSLEKDVRRITLASDRVPQVYFVNGELYNLWQDDKNVKGVWRGSLSLPPDYERTLIHLSRGGKDANVIREFNLKTKKFVKGGFEIPEAKGFISWKDKDTVYVGTNFGPDSMTNSGYQRIVKEWKRGTPLSEAKTVIEAKKTDMSAYSFVQFNPEGRYIFHKRQISFYEKELWYEDPSGKKILIPMPPDAAFNGVFKKHLLYVLRSDLAEFKKGSLVAMPIEKLVEGKKAQESLQLVMAPTDRKFIQDAICTKDFLLIQTLDNVLSKIVKADLLPSNHWSLEEIPLGKNGMAEVYSSEDDSNVYLAQYTDFLTPSSIFVAHSSDKNNKFDLLKKSPERFNSEGLTVERFEAISKDGTKIPYFLVSKKNVELNGKNPTLLYGYGGFETPLQPFYLGITGKAWVERGGVYVLSNLRGGGEFGPAWHQAVLKENRYKVFEDNIAIAEDLIKRKITSPKHLGISGRSNGGLLTAATFVLRPDLFNAVIVGVPLLDMLRYHKLLAGASWMDEYGNPDEPKMREAILKYSPYQNVSSSVKYPEVFFMTSTKDDRVHPGHARKMVEKMKDQGHSVFYYENMEGGHAGNANLEQSVLWNTLEYTYLWEKLGHQ